MTPTHAPVVATGTVYCGGVSKGHRPGAVVTLPTAHADALIAAGVAKPHTPPVLTAAATTPTPPAAPVAAPEAPTPTPAAIAEADAALRQQPTPAGA